jgi:hypothetical protein
LTTSCTRSKAVRKERTPEHVDRDDRLEGVPDRDPRRDPERDAARRISGERADRDRRPEPRAEEEERRNGDPRGRPDGRG